MERYLKFREEYSRFFYRDYDVEETLNELKITYTFEIEGLSVFTPTWTFPKNGNTQKQNGCEDPLDGKNDLLPGNGRVGQLLEDHLLSTGGDRGRKFNQKSRSSGGKICILMVLANFSM